MAVVESIEVVAIGEELLNGATLDSNAAVIARELEPLGLRVVRKTTVGDVVSAISEAVAAALERTRAVVTTGGLGPTRDDVTRRAVAAVFDRPLRFREDLWAALVRRWALRGRQIPETNRVQAEVPEGAEVLANPRGTAPAIAIEDEERGLCILLPGVPSEVEAILPHSVVPYLAQRVEARVRRPYRRQLRTAGIAESGLAQLVGDRLDDLPLEVAYLPKLIGVDLRLTAWARDEDQARGALDEAVDRLQDMLARWIYAEGDADLAEVVGGLLRQRGLRVAVAESCTGGMLGARLTETPGSSDYFWGGTIVYDDRAKIELLGVSEMTLRRYGAVSEMTAREMAEGAARRSGAETGLAVTGIAGPSGGTEEKPVGTVWLAARVRDTTMVERHHYPGTRELVRRRAAQGALDLLRRTLLEGGS